MFTYNFQERRLKIKLLQQRALELEDQREALEDKGLNPLQVAQELEKVRREMELGKAVSNAKPENPLIEDKRIIQNLGISNTGLLGSHKILSNTKSQYSNVDKHVQLHNKLRARKKARAQKRPGEDAEQKVQKTQEDRELDLLEQQYKHAKEQDKRMKQETYQDHISYLFQAKTGEEKKSQMQRDFSKAFDLSFLTLS
jgi:hypothetical protein